MGPTEFVVVGGSTYISL